MTREEAEDRRAVHSRRHGGGTYELLKPQTATSSIHYNNWSDALLGHPQEAALRRGLGGQFAAQHSPLLVSAA